LATPTIAFAQAVTGGYSPQTMLSNACAFVLGPFGQSIAVLFIMGLGVAWMAGRASLHLLGQVIGGIVLLFGAAYLQQTLTGSGG
jgi:type IV secretion system protein VirB2